ncbi:MAG: hypothetical protein JKX97_08840 [Candidatus Lindowbacteria bacterium]|nr:hypothetical protein [Candidatus Lindowbacteria bacterium]
MKFEVQFPLTRISFDSESRDSVIELLHTLFGTINRRGFESTEYEDAICKTAAKFLEDAPQISLFLKEVIAHLARIQATFHLPKNNGCKKECRRIAGKIFSTFENCSVLGLTHIAEEFENLGCKRLYQSEYTDILIRNSNDQIQSKLCFSLGESSAHSSQFHFSASDIDAMVQIDISDKLPAGFDRELERAADSILRSQNHNSKQFSLAGYSDRLCYISGENNQTAQNALSKLIENQCTHVHPNLMKDYVSYLEKNFQ